MKNRPYYIPKGLSTTGYSGGAPDEFDVFQNADTDHGGFEARGGMVRLAKIADVRGILDFDGTDDAVTLLANPLFSGTAWTLEILFVVDDISSDRYIIGGATATVGIKIRQTTTSTVVIDIRDSAGTTTTLTHTGVAASTLCGLQLTRNGATLTSWLNGNTQTGTMSATNELATNSTRIGVHNSANWLDGAVDYVRGWSVVRATKQDIYRRLQNPRNRNVLFDYVTTQGTASTPDVRDRSAFGLHAAVAGTPTWARTPLSKSAPIQGGAYSVRKNGTKEIVVISAGRPYYASVT